MSYASAQISFVTKTAIDLLSANKSGKFLRKEVSVVCCVPYVRTASHKSETIRRNIGFPNGSRQMHTFNVISKDYYAEF